MKNLLTILLIAITTPSYSQDTYNNKFDSANRVEINGGKTTILKADSVFIGNIIILNNKTFLYLSEYTKIKDSFGIYTTTFKFQPGKQNAWTDVNLTITFDNPITRAKVERPTMPSKAKLDSLFDELRWAFVSANLDSPYVAEAVKGASSINKGISNDNKTIVIYGSVMGEALMVRVKSKKTLYATISGIDGKLKK